MTATTPVQLGCPYCGSTDITSFERTVTAYYGVRFYKIDKEGGVIVDYDGVYDTEGVDDGGEYADDLSCRGCLELLSESALVPVEVAE